ncbi:MAG: metallophosphoesterase [Bacteroidales bacterium]|nr:metallophosphoesterase [Candidatus Sodaliphilus aphodohippi]
MLIQYASDFHLEFPQNRQWLKENPLEVKGDILILSGDVMVLGVEDSIACDFLDWCSTNFKQTYIVPGNHEYYHGIDVADTLYAWERKLRDNVTYLNNRSVIIGDTELFFTTLWTKVPKEDENIVEKVMNDCQLIQYKGNRLRACDFNTIHETCFSWLTKALQASTAPKQVVVTHHCPVQVEDPRYASNGLTKAFIIPLEQFIADSSIKAWIFGHTHYNGARGMDIGGCKICTCQLGYIPDVICENFIRSAVIEL